MGRQMKVGYGTIGVFRPISLYISETVHDRHIIWNANRYSYVLYRMVLFPVTLNDPNYPKPPYFRHVVSRYISL